METHNPRSVYLDYNATTPLEPAVLDAIQAALRDAWGNPSSCYEQGKKAKTIIENSRKSVASMIDGCADGVIFTSGGTEANNMVIQTAIKFYWKTLEDLELKGKLVNSEVKQSLPHIITSNLEHDSVKLVLQHLEEDSQIEVTYVPASHSSGRVEVDDIISALRPNTCMITLMLANNETGVIQPVREVCLKVRQMKRRLPEFPRILLHTDAAQAIGKIAVSVDDLDVDYLTVVGHKFYAPRIGALYVSNLRKGTPVYPMLYGGGQERNYRPGTENTGMIAGLGKAADLVVDNLPEYEKHLREIRDYLEKRLQEEFQVHVNGKYAVSERLPNTCNVSFLNEGLIGSKVLASCQNLQASIGAACHSHDSLKPSPILLASGTPEDIAVNAIRLSVGRSTTKQDIDVVITDLKQATQLLQAT